MNYVCGDNRFEIIERYKKKLTSATNIEDSPDEMAVLDNILYRFWQMGWLKEQEPVKPVLDEQTGRIWLCGKCGSYVGFEDNDPHDPNEFDKYCRECGRPVLWEGRWS